ncbi:hypothetical protein TEA_028720 [Camellia sinensis var. sinensis]|uniref:Uncharacterized protein n=1 Tax=Camellia sinensis var. sinensis TaxID=542762 RepID=A0A4S4EAG9_CAMSN|nr:hypothetical protein TEA_028720 [Camellia sinensis var. sinensis]
MSRSAVELNFSRMEKENSSKKFIDCRRSFRDIQSVISKLNPQLLETVIASGSVDHTYNNQRISSNLLRNKSQTVESAADPKLALSSTDKTQILDTINRVRSCNGLRRYFVFRLWTEVSTRTVGCVVGIGTYLGTNLGLTEMITRRWAELGVARQEANW